MKKNRFFTLIAGVALFIFLFAYAEQFTKGLGLGLNKCSQIVIPSLFPFLVAASLTGSGEMPAKAKKAVNPIIQRLFRLPAETLPAIIISQLGGYLAGAKSAQSLYQSGALSKSQASRLMLFSVNAGIGFSVNAVGRILLGSEKTGKIIFLSLCFSSLLTGLLTRFLPECKEDIKRLAPRHISFSDAVVESVASSATAMLTACAFVAFFSGITSIIDSCIKNESLRLAAECLLEVTNGCVNSAGKLSIPMLAAVCAFGGICVHLQIFSIAKDIGINMPVFFFFRILHAFLAFISSSVLLKLFPIEEQTFLSISQNAALWSFSAPASVSLLFLSALLILDLDNKTEIC